MQHTPDQIRRMRVYRERNCNLKAMGFKNYAEYQKSELWQSIRARVLAANPFCVGCGQDATQVHHSAYRKKDLEGRDLRRLFSACGGCHFKAEFRRRDHEKLHPKQATTKLKQLASANAKKRSAIFDPLFA
jgi:hypothetical protein